MSINEVVRDSSEHGKSELARIAYLDGWRGLAIFLVLISHFTPIKGISLGEMGVDVFFVLSGMLMANILYVKRIPLSIFYKRRISRIFPVFVLYVCIIYGTSYIFNLSKEHHNIIYTLLFIRSYFPVEPGLVDNQNIGLPIGHIWSLNVEEHCYIFLSLIALTNFIKKKEHLPLFILSLVTLLLHYLHIKFPSINTPNYIMRTEIAAKPLLLSAGYFLIKHKFEKFVPRWLPVITFLLTFLCYHWRFSHFAAYFIAPFLLAFTVNHLNLLSTTLLFILELNILRLLGIWSYSIYLWQQPLFFYGKEIAKIQFMSGPVLLLLSITFGALSFYFFENPIRKYLNNKW